MRILLLTALISVGVAATLIAITQSLILSSPTTVTHWKFRTRAPVIVLYDKVSSILPKCTSFSAVVNTGRHNSLFAIVLVSGYTLTNNVTKKHLVEGVEFLFREVSKIVVVPFDFSLKELKLSYLFVQLIRSKSLSYALTLINRTANVTSLATEYKLNITSNMLDKVSSISRNFLSSIASYGLLTRMQILPYEFYSAQHSLPRPSALEPLFIVCNSRTRVCVATMYGRLRVVVQNVRIQVPVVT